MQYCHDLHPVNMANIRRTTGFETAELLVFTGFGPPTINNGSMLDK
jgi:hypothetical protein